MAHPDGSDTRERILEVALRRFVDQGYDKTSLREIAEDMGFTKAALYYHFASKEDILLALHLRLHDLGRDALRRLREGPPSVGAWSALMQGMVDDVISQRDLIVLHGRNSAALESLQEKHDHDGHDDMHEEMRAALADRSIPAADRVRLGAAMGALFSGLVLAGDALGDIAIAELSEELRAVIRDILGPAAPQPAAGAAEVS